MSIKYSLVAGKNIFSLFFALRHSALGNSLYFVDDPQIRMGRKSREFFSYFELGLMKELGRNFKINAFVEIDKFSRPMPIEFIQRNLANSKHVALSDSFSENYNELFRHGLIDKYDGNFTNDFTLYLNDLCSALAKSNSSSSSLDRSSFIVSGHSKMSDYLDTQAINWGRSLKEKDWHLHTLVEQLSAFYSLRFCSRYLRTEILYLLISALSGVARVDYLACENELGLELEANNAISRVASVIDYDIDNKSILSGMLSTHDGLIEIEKLYQFGPRPLFGHPLELSDRNFYGWRSLKANLVAAPSEERKIVVISSFRDMSSDTPVRFYYLEKNGDVEINSFVRFLPGSKDSFFKDQLKETLRGDVEKFFYVPSSEFSLASLDWGDDYIFMQGPVSSYVPPIPLRSVASGTELSYESAVYLGDFNENANGAISQFMRASYE